MRFLKATLVLFLGVVLFSCNKDDDEKETVEEVPYAVQAPKDDLAINTFLDEYHMEVTNDFQDVKFVKIPSPNSDNLQSIRSEYTLQTKIVKVEEVDHKIYYISFREGTVGEKPTGVDSVYVSYKGEYIYTKKEEITPSTDPKTYKEYIASTQFDASSTPIWFPLSDVVRGWREIITLFKTGNHSVGENGSVTFSDFGAGVMFLPSGLGYYSGHGSIPAHTPLIFNFGVKKMNFVDNDYDGLDSRYEDLNNNGDFTDDDTDLDQRPNYLDQDDDGDGLLTKEEKAGDEDGDGVPNYLDKDTKIKRS